MLTLIPCMTLMATSLLRAFPFWNAYVIIYSSLYVYQRSPLTLDIIRFISIKNIFVVLPSVLAFWNAIASNQSAPLSAHPCVTAKLLQYVSEKLFIWMPYIRRYSPRLRMHEHWDVIRSLSVSSVDTHRFICVRNSSTQLNFSYNVFQWSKFLVAPCSLLTRENRWLRTQITLF